MTENKPRRPLTATRHDLEDFTDRPAAAPSGTRTASHTGTLSFSGKRGQLFKLALVNSILTILTLGIYRFWAKTNIRRYFWSNIQVQNEPLEYTGKAMELLIGFLVVLAILVPIFALYQGALFLVSSSSEYIQFGLQFAYALTLLGFFQYAYYRMWRYRFSRTTWRGIRFAQDGSAWVYMALTMGWMVATLLTIGVAYPWLRNAQWNYRIRHLKFGEQAFSYSGRVADLAKKWAFVMGVPLLILVAIITFKYETISILGTHFPMGTDKPNQEFIAALKELGWFWAGLGIAYFSFPFLYTWYRVNELNYVLGETQFAEATFHGSIRTFPIIGWFFVTILAIMVVIGIPSSILGFMVSNLTQGQPPSIATLVIPIIGFLFLLVATSIISTVILTFSIVKHIFSHIKINNPDSLVSVSQASSSKPAFGEGLADALDVGAF